MSHGEIELRRLPGILAWLILGIALGFGQKWMWPSVWSLTLLVWWAYLILTVVLLLRLLTLPPSRSPRAAVRSLVWTLVALAAVLWWSHPLLVRVGEDVLRLLRPATVVQPPSNALALGPALAPGAGATSPAWLAEGRAEDGAAAPA